MKKTFLIFIALTLTFSILISCNDQSATTNSVNSTMSEISKQEESSIHNFTESDDEITFESSIVTTSKENNNDANFFPYYEYFPAIEKLLASDPDAASEYPDLSALDSILDFKYCWFSNYNGQKNTITIAATDLYGIAICKLPKETEAFAPFHLVLNTALSKNVTICDSHEEMNKKGNTAYKYYKEGIDVYWADLNGGGTINVCFVIDGYAVKISGSKNFRFRESEFFESGSKFMEPSAYETLKLEFENNTAVLETMNIYTQESELIRVLKDCIEKAK